MITVLLGTSPYPFTRLVQAVDRWARDRSIRVVCQVGHTPRDALRIETHTFVPHSQILEWISQSKLLVTQGGFGSLYDCVSSGKPTIAVPRRVDLGESKDSQTDLCDELRKQGRIRLCTDVGLLGGMMDEELRSPINNEGSGHSSRIPNIIAESLEKFRGKST